MSTISVYALLMYMAARRYHYIHQFCGHFIAKPLRVGEREAWVKPYHCFTCNRISFRCSFLWVL